MTTAPSSLSLTGFEFAGKHYKVIPLSLMRIDPDYQHLYSGGFPEHDQQHHGGFRRREDLRHDER